jgi:antitoxin component of RelBE/YafQ-DinJ toxin-antitoxin module
MLFDMKGRSAKLTADVPRSVLHVRIDRELKEKLEQVAKRSGMDLSNYCRAAMVEKATRDGWKL